MYGHPVIGSDLWAVGDRNKELLLLLLLLKCNVYVKILSMKIGVGKSCQAYKFLHPGLIQKP